MNVNDVSGEYINAYENPIVKVIYFKYWAQTQWMALETVLISNEFLRSHSSCLMFSFHMLTMMAIKFYLQYVVFKLYLQQLTTDIILLVI